jgi:hypothetical protein
LFRINRRYYDEWDARLKPVFAKAQQGDMSVKRELLDILHACRYHLNIAVHLQEDQEWKAAGLEVDANLRGVFVSYTNYLLRNETESGWNKPGRDKAQYRKEAGL